MKGLSFRWRIVTVGSLVAIGWGAVILVLFVWPGPGSFLPQFFFSVAAVALMMLGGFFLLTAMMKMEYVRLKTVVGEFIEGSWLLGLIMIMLESLTYLNAPFYQRLIVIMALFIWLWPLQAQGKLLFLFEPEEEEIDASQGQETQTVAPIYPPEQGQADYQAAQN